MLPGPVFVSTMGLSTQTGQRSEGSIADTQPLSAFEMVSRWADHAVPLLGQRIVVALQRVVERVSSRRR
jgi:hypothetical protein